MPGRDKGSSGGGRSEDERLRDLAARERARQEGKRPPPSFGPSTRAGRERAVSRGDVPGAPPPAPTSRAAPADGSFDFDFARPSTRVAGGDGGPPRRDPVVRRVERANDGAPPATPAREPDPVAATVDPEVAAPATRAATATVTEPWPGGAPADPAPDEAPRRSRRRAEPGGDPTFASLRSAGRPRPEQRARRARSAGPPWRRIAVLGAGIVLLGGGLAFALGGGGDDEPAASEQAKEAAKPSPYGEPTPTPMPPRSRVVAYTGAPQADELGILGTMPVERASDRLARQSRPYDRASRPVVPAFDLIATIANAHPGPAGKYRTRQTGKVIARYLRAARRHDAALILDVQPGTSNFVDELRPLEKWLKEPDVHLALDPEWRMRPGVQPGSEIGWVSGGEVTATLNRVARIVRANDLPPKLVIVHRFTDGMIKDLESVDVPKEIVGVISIDGVGSRTDKIHTYDRIAPTLPKPWLPGFKVFYEEDAEAGGIMYGSQVMSLKPRPHVVLYE